jgi:ribulose-phosphate 3-epimerase
VPVHIRIAPSILAADFTQLGQQIAAAEAAGADRIHIDVMDGRFVPNITMGPLVVEAARRVTGLSLDVHLMIVEPEKHVNAFVNAGANTIIVHFETCPHLHRVVQQIRQAGASAGIALNPHTPVMMVKEMLPHADLVLIMTVNPGFGGQAFIYETLGKIRDLRAMIEASGREIDVAVDGGIDRSTAPQVVEAGANMLVVGTSVFRAPGGIQSGIDILRQVVGT